MINKSINNVYISMNEGKAYISLAIFYSKRMQDMNISIALAIPLRYLPFHQCSPKWIKRPFKWPVNGKWW